MANEIFVDTSGYYAMLVRDDDGHAGVGRILRDARKRKRRFVTTDYVLDETATLLKARKLTHRCTTAFAPNRTCGRTRRDSLRWIGTPRTQPMPLARPSVRNSTSPRKTRQMIYFSMKSSGDR